MNDLYGYDATQEIESLRSKIQNYILTNNSGLQRNIHRYVNLKDYTSHREDPEKSFSKHVNLLYVKSKNYLDSTEEEFVSSFSSNYKEKIFELVIADLLIKKFKLTERVKNKEKIVGEADFMFTHQSKNYFLECTTRNTSLMDKYAKQFYKFDVFYKIVLILQQRHDELKNIDENSWLCCWSGLINQIWYRLEETHQKEICRLLNTTHVRIDPKLLFKEFQEWIYYNMYALSYFPDLIQIEILEKLRDAFPAFITHDTEKHAIYTKFLIQSITRMIIDKLQKKYFEKNTPVILALSLSSLQEFLLTHSIFNSFENMTRKIAIELTNNAHDYVDNNETLKKLSENSQSLYAIIIDTTWYNWFPEIVEKKYQTKWPDSNKNCYIVVYNSHISAKIDCDFHIFSSIIKNQIDLPLTINSREKELTSEECAL